LFGGIQFPGAGGFGFGGLNFGAPPPGDGSGGASGGITRYHQCGGEGAECSRWGPATGK
jgi:hypothetical protein